MAINRIKVQARAEKLVSQGKIVPAIEQYKTLLKDQPNDLATLNRVGDLLARIGKGAEATHLFGRAGQLYTAGGFYPKAIAIYKKILKLDPTAIEARLCLADLYAQGDFTTNARAEYVAVAAKLVRDGFDAKAREVYEKLIRMEPANVEARTALAEIYLGRGDVARAVAELRHAARDLERLGVKEGSLKLHRRILELDLADLEPLAHSARAAIHLGAFDLAISAALRLREKFPEESVFLEVHIEALERAGRTEESEELAKSSLGDSAESAVARAVLGRLHARAGRISSAAPLLISAAQEFFLQDRFDEAAKALDTLLELDPSHPGALPLRIEVARAMGADEEIAILSRNLGVTIGPTAPLPAGGSGQEGREKAHGAPRAYTVEEKDFLDERLTEAEVFFKYGLFNKAVEPLQDILGHFPDHLEAHLRLKAVYVERGDPGRAVDECLKVADLHERAGDREQTIATLVEAHNLDPDHASVRSRLEQLGVLQASLPVGSRSRPAGQGGLDVEIALEDRAAGPVAPSGIAGAPGLLSPAGGAEPGEGFFDLAGEFGDSLAEVLAAEEAPVLPPPTEQSFEDVFRAFQQRVDEVVDSQDFKTHYELAIAYKEMGLIDEAIAEFEYATKDPHRVIECCSMLALCLREKGEHARAEGWCVKGLESSMADPAQSTGLRYELAEIYMDMREFSKAREMYLQVAGVDGNYRDVSARLKEAERAAR